MAKKTGAAKSRKKDPIAEELRALRFLVLDVLTKLDTLNTAEKRRDANMAKTAKQYADELNAKWDEVTQDVAKLTTVAGGTKTLLEALTARSEDLAAQL